MPTNGETFYLKFAQWQGAGRVPELWDGVQALAAALDLPWRTLEVARESELVLEGGILGRGVLLEQLRSARSLLADLGPSRILTVAGECSAELAPVATLARRHPAMTLVWIDAHADANTPASSPSGTFHGMPLRHLLGEGDAEVLAELGAVIEPDQVILVGVRELDPPEADLVERLPLRRVGVEELNRSPRALADLLERADANCVYVHLDVDVIDPHDLGSVACPTPDGIRLEALVDALERLHGVVDVVGAGCVEYLPRDPRDLESVTRLLRALFATR